MKIAEVSWPVVDEAATSVAVVPVGSTEQHGPHAPLGTDSLIAEIIAEKGIKSYDDEVILTPALQVGVSAEHRHFSGTLWITPDTLRGYIRDVATSLAHHGFDRVVIVNGHGGNTSTLREIAAELYRDEIAYACVFTWFESIDRDDHSMGHAGPIETAMIRHHFPELIDEHRITDAREGGAERWGEWIAGTNLAYDTIEFTDNGVVGDPSRGNTELGENLTESASNSLGQLLEAVENRSLPFENSR